jgi:hypothetical protein
MTGSCAFFSTRIKTGNNKAKTIRKIEEVDVTKAVQEREYHCHNNKNTKNIDFLWVCFLVVWESDEAGNNDKDRDRNVNKKYILPILVAENVKNGAAREGTENIGDAVNCTNEPECHTPFLFRK